MQFEANGTRRHEFTVVQHIFNDFLEFLLIIV